MPPRTRPATEAAHKSRRKNASESEEGSRPPYRPFAIVGIGASAGGLEAILDLLPHLPADSGMAFVFVQHMAANHKNVLPDLLAQHSALPVVEVRDGARIEPDTFWVATPSADVEVWDGHWKLVPRDTTRGLHMPIDLFFKTLAQTQGNRAVGVVLSGSGSDGTEGVKALKEAGGLVLAQDPGTAKFDSMPRSAITTGCVDIVLPPRGLGRELVRLSRDPYLAHVLQDSQDPEQVVREADADAEMLAILKLIEQATGSDFSGYKRTTLARRIRRRMAIQKSSTLTDYAQFLEANEQELHDLRNDILINVTSFFRNPEAFEALSLKTLPALLKDRSPQMPLRAWVCGCATGEEAYSVAICLLEAVQSVRVRTAVQVFGTDVSAWAVERARAGIYPESIAASVSPERLAQFFTKNDDTYRVNQRVRDVCVFACQDFSRDPPFSRLDLITCRNVLIYLEPELQKRVLALFHYALNPTGQLMLGSAETVGASSTLFNLVDREHKLYSKAVVSSPHFLSYPARQPAGAHSAPRTISADTSAGLMGGYRLDAHNEADRAVLARYAPDGVLVDGDFNVLHFRGDTNAYLAHREGQASFSILKLVRKELLVELRAALTEARSKNLPARRERLRFRIEGKPRTTSIQVLPIRTPISLTRCFVVLFEDTATRPRRTASPEPMRAVPRGPRAQVRRILELEQELLSARHHQQTVVQEYQAVNEELQSANEEVLSSNEELQSINEELETAKEELQAGNEELTTLNDELNHRNAELAETSDDLANILSSLDVPIVMLTQDLTVRMFTPAAGTLLNLIPSDIGRSFAHLKPNIEGPNLEQWVRTSMTAMSVVERDVQDRDGRWYSLRVRPYRTGDNHIEGAVMILLDIDLLKQTAQRIESARAYANAIVETVNEPLLILNEALEVEKANLCFYETFRTSVSETEGCFFFDLARGAWNDSALRARLEDVLARRQTLDAFEITHDFPHLGTRTMKLSGHRLWQEKQDGQPDKILVAIEDLTAAREAEDREQLVVRLEQDREREAQANRFKDEFLATLSHELRGPLNSMVGWSQLIRTGALDAATTLRGLGAIDRGIQAQRRLIEDLLDVSRVVAGKLSLNRNLVNLVAIAEAAWLSVRQAADAKALQLEFQAQEEVLTVYGDADRLQQVILNLLTNAIRFTPADGRVALRMDTDGRDVRLVVSDTGQGISSDFLPHVFERFRQADSSSTRRYSGLGLGLAIVSHLVELHGGQVRAESDGDGQGATFTVTLPAPPLMLEATEPPGSVPSLEAFLTANGGALENLHVLVVDDDADARGLLAYVLTRCGAEVTMAASPDEAMEAFGLKRYDLLASDIAMPGKDGYDLIRRVRALPADQGGRVPALALTAFAGDRDRANALSAGFQDHIAKPLNPAEVVAKLLALSGRPMLN